MYRVTPFNPLLKFSQSKIVYTLKENNLVKTRLDLNTNFIADVSVWQPFSRQFVFTLSKIKIKLHRRFGENRESHFISHIISFYIIKMKRKLEIKNGQNFDVLLMPIKCQSSASISSILSKYRSSPHGQQLHWPGPKSGWQHQVCHHSTEIGITRHGSSTYKMPAVLPPKGLHLMLPRFPELQWLKRTS